MGSREKQQKVEQIVSCVLKLDQHRSFCTQAGFPELQTQNSCVKDQIDPQILQLSRRIRTHYIPCSALFLLSHSVSLLVPSLLLVFPEKKVQFQRSINGECPLSSSMLIMLGLSTCSSLPCFGDLLLSDEK